MSWRKSVLIVGAAVLGGAVCYLSAGALAPAVGAYIGSTILGWSGCAATSSGLAFLGGGSLASGGAGMAGGTLAVTVASTGTGAVASGVATKLVVDGLGEDRSDG